MSADLMIKKINAHVIIKYFLIPSAVLTLYLASFKLFSSLLPIEGVNTVFANKASKYMLYLTVVLGLTSLVLFLIGRKGSPESSLKPSKLKAIDLLLILLPLTPVMQYTIVNHGILSATDIVIVLTFFTVFSMLYIFLVPTILGFIQTTRILAAIGVAFCMTVASMSLLSQQFNWFADGSLKIQLLYLLMVFFLAWMTLCLDKAKFLYLIIVIYFIANSSIQLISQFEKVSLTKQAAIDQKLEGLIGDKKPKQTPNIYLLVYDSYVSNETLLSYGIDNSAHETYLKQNDFVIYPQLYSTGSATLETMRVVFQLSDEYRADSRSGVSGDGLIHETLSKIGYKNYGVFENEHMFKGVGSSYAESFPKSSKPQYEFFIAAILTGEFRFDLEFNSQTRQQFIDMKHKALEDPALQPKFIYAHTFLPNHSQNSGACRVNETELYQQRLAQANEEMKQDLDVILQNDPGSIVIIAGDHGPALTKNCNYLMHSYPIDQVDRLDIQDRYGVFLAIRWPTVTYQAYDQFTVLQDLFPVILSYLFDDAALLDMRVEPVTQFPYAISKAKVEHGIIRGGIDDGEPLFIGDY